MEPRLYFIAHPPELSDDKFRRSGRVGGIVETDMHPCSDFARKERAIFVRPAADGDHIIPRFTEVFRDVVGRMTANVDPRFGHRLDRLRVYPFGRLRSGGKDLRSRIERLQEAVRHLTAATVSGA